MTDKFSDERKAIARLLVAMLYEGRYSARNLGWIYNRYGKYLSGVSFESFSSYLDSENDPLDDVRIPPYIVVGLWEMVNVPRCTCRIPEALRRRLASASYSKSRSRGRSVSRAVRCGSADLPCRSRKNDEERGADAEIAAETSV